VSKTPAQQALPAKTAAKKTAAPARAKAAPAAKKTAKAAPAKAPAQKTLAPPERSPRAAAPAKTGAAKTAPAPKPAASARRPEAPASAPVPAAAAPAPAPAPSPSPAKAFSQASAGRASLSATMNKSNDVLDQPRASLPPPDPKLANAWKTKAGKDLTDAEVLAMPESEYMNDKQLEFFRHKLLSLKEDLLSNAGETTEHLREDTSIVPDPADRATIEEEHALELRTRDRERKLLKKIAQALARIDAGDYGFCDETGEPIGLGRLIARPTATLSLEAQQRRELKQKMFGD
jgi:DnaK suppressor protein